MITYLAAQAVLGGDDGQPELVPRARVDVDDAGRIVRAGPESELPPARGLVRDLGPALLLPGLVNGHSHAFQRAIRGATHRRSAADPSDFWSWREAMYTTANALEPDSFYAETRRAYKEMLAAGITCVGEFHYVHHRPDGTPYDDPNELSMQVVRAASDVGIRLVLLEVFYARAGAGKPPMPEQRRFCDASVDAYLTRLDDLRGRGARVGVAPHSIRAADLEAIGTIAEYANANDLPIHAHVSEQPRENDECHAELGCSPVAAFARAGALTTAGRFTAVHAIHIDDADRELLRGHNVCACPTTEADLGDGIVGASRLRTDGVNLALGSDSNAVIDLVQEARLLEMHERLATQRRLRLTTDAGALGLALCDIATRGGARALGVEADAGTLAPGRAFDAAAVQLDHMTLRGVEPANVLDALFAAGTSQVIDRVWVGGAQT